MSNRRFRFRPLLAVATIAFCAVAIWAGLWQTRRAEEKAGIQARLDRLATDPAVMLPATVVDARDFALRRVVAQGEFDEPRTIFLDNKVLHGRAGYHVVSPLRLAGGERYVLVDRGWVAAGRTREELPRVPTPPGAQRVEGVAVVPGAVYELAAEPPAGRVWQNLQLDRFAQRSGLALQPIVVQQTSDADDGLARDWPRPDAGVDKHRIYALQWYSFAALAAVLYVFLSFKRPS